MSVPPYRLAIFDFDGTLADSYPWFTGVINDVADRYGFSRVAPEDEERLRVMSAADIVRHLDIAWWKLPLIARHLRARAAADIDRIALFPGIDALLTRLVEHGVTLTVVSSNAESNVRRVLGPLAERIAHYGCGAALFGKRRKLRRAMRRTGFRAGDAICIGDEIRDHEAATAEGMAFAAVGWGYTAAEALAARQPQAVCRTVDDLGDLLLKPC